jgi:APA family basic amino acid/polyamine antiporter
MASRPKPITPKLELARDLGPSHAIAVVVGTIIGSGIFLVPTEMMQAVGSAKLVYLAWIVGGLLSFFGALTYAELGALKPEAGGEYVYIRDAYGPMPAFVYAWTWFVIAKPASIASLATGFVRILGSFPPLHFFSAPLPFATNLNYGQLVAVAAAILISFINYIGIKRAGEFQLVFTILKVAIVLAIVFIAFTYGEGTWQNFGSTFSGAKGGMVGFMAALVAALWAYDGWNDLNMVSGEIRNPERSIPLALIAGVAVVGVLYMLLNAAVQYVLPAPLIAASPRPASDAIAAVLGAAGAAVVSAGMALSMLVAMNGTIMSGARIPFAVARDGYFFHSLATVHPRFRTPSVSIIVQAILSIALLLVAGSAKGDSFKRFFSVAIFSEWLFYMVAASTIFVFRRRLPDARRPYSTWGYPVLPALFVAASAVLLYYTLADSLHDRTGGYLVLLACAVILAGVPIFYLFAHRRS